MIYGKKGRRIPKISTFCECQTKIDFLVDKKMTTSTRFLQKKKHGGVFHFLVKFPCFFVFQKCKIYSFFHKKSKFRKFHKKIRFCYFYALTIFYKLKKNPHCKKFLLFLLAIR